MAALIGGSGEVAIVDHDQTSRTGIDRRDGFVNEIKAKFPNVKVVDIQYGAGDQLKSTDLTKAIIQAHPQLKGIYGCNEGSAIGVLNGVVELKKQGKIKIIGFDSSKALKAAVKSGVISGAITQDPGFHRLQDRRVRRQSPQGRETAQGDRHRVQVVGQDQHGSA